MLGLKLNHFSKKGPWWSASESQLERDVASNEFNVICFGHENAFWLSFNEFPPCSDKTSVCWNNGSASDRRQIINWTNGDLVEHMYAIGRKVFKTPFSRLTFKIGRKYTCIPISFHTAWHLFYQQRLGNAASGSGMDNWLHQREIVICNYSSMPQLQWWFI